MNDAKTIVAGCGRLRHDPRRLEERRRARRVVVGARADGDRVVVAADDVDELGVDRALERRDDVGGLAAERVGAVEPLVLRRVAERLVGVEEIRRGELVAGPRDVLRVEVEERLLVAVDPVDRRLVDHRLDRRGDRREEPRALRAQRLFGGEVRRDARAHVLDASPCASRSIR